MTSAIKAITTGFNTAATAVANRPIIAKSVAAGFATAAVAAAVYSSGAFDPTYCVQTCTPRLFGLLSNCEETCKPAIQGVIVKTANGVVSFIANHKFAVATAVGTIITTFAGIQLAQSVTQKSVVAPKAD